MKLGRELMTNRVDVLHVCNPPETFFPLGWLIKATGGRFLFDHHDLSPEMYDAKFGAEAEGGGSSSLMRRGLLFLERRTFRAADLVITTNESHKRVAVERGGKDPDDVLVVRSGPDLERLEQVEPVDSWRRGPALSGGLPRGDLRAGRCPPPRRCHGRDPRPPRPRTMCSAC